ncbi:MAG: extracellular solute-binding protein [Clostridia bacterium]|nr:extracellular solute-binding protein [Clostridia bacterium]
MKKIARVIAALLCGVLLMSAIGMMHGCDDKKPTLKVWAANVDVEMTKGFVKDFLDKNPDFGYRITVATQGENEAATTLKNAPDDAADVVHIPHDQIGILTQGTGFIHEIPAESDAYKQIMAENTQSVIDVAGKDGKLYGFPTMTETYLLYYNKSMFDADDVKSFEKMFEKALTLNVGNDFAAFGLKYDDGFYAGMFNLATDNYLYKDNNVQNVSFATDEGVAAAEFIRDMNGVKRARHVATSSDAATQFKAGSLGSFVSGPWDKNAFEEALGDNFAVAALPTFTVTVNGEQKTFSPKAFLNAKLYVVNKATKDSRAAIKLAQYLSSKEVQLSRYAQKGYLPVNAELADDPAIAQDGFVQAVLGQMQNAIPQPNIAEMGNRWYKPQAGQGKFKVIFDNKDGVASDAAKIRAILTEMESYLKTGKEGDAAASSQSL